MSGVGEFSSDTDEGRSLIGDKSSSDATASFAFVNGRWRCNDIAEIADLDTVIVERSRHSYIADFLDPYDMDPAIGYADSYATTVSIHILIYLGLYLYIL